MDAFLNCIGNLILYMFGFMLVEPVVVLYAICISIRVLFSFRGLFS